ncbi:MAG: hypothetical protein A2015_05145 [Spirochaetes bacterium GWF1_31_7]|nr:MAG: hypothetical protein A2Y30_06540 [Spirochaetes bacterium GWE1_32_154]OHD47230.1 MAG: hypothetical protein A2015_05145 [Spirochaetes bacterium GWF1_31_7]OHD80927.1 MAG: hypothetical protein A2355_00560 [Spirochaetes bacterium RIFOXYB1_FULL_32_8]HBD94292.1 hypothetical protein [Spirochaetia bacterium]HBI36177.1 hypothetical protein [Spirochaetia bacterium]
MNKKVYYLILHVFAITILSTANEIVDLEIEKIKNETTKVKFHLVDNLSTSNSGSFSYIPPNSANMEDEYKTEDTLSDELKNRINRKDIWLIGTRYTEYKSSIASVISSGLIFAIFASITPLPYLAENYLNTEKGYSTTAFTLSTGAIFATLSVIGLILFIPSIVMAAKSGKEYKMIKRGIINKLNGIDVSYLNGMKIRFDVVLK